MVLWGAVWGAVLGLFLVRHDEGLGFFLGAVLGAVAGLTLRRAVHTAARKAAQEVLAEQHPTVLVARTAPSDGAPPGPAVAPVAAAAPADPVSATDWRVDMPIRVPRDAVAQVPTNATSVPSEFHDTHSGTLSTDQTKRPAAARAAQMPNLVSRAVGAARAWLLGGNTIVRMGVLVLFVGLAFLAKYAMDNAMLPPELRLAAHHRVRDAARRRERIRAGAGRARGG